VARARHARAHNYESGISLAGDYSFPYGFRVATNFVLFQTLDAEKDGLSFLVHRYPIGLEGSWSYRRERWFATGL
jgi:hypothetical protein